MLESHPRRPRTAVAHHLRRHVHRAGVELRSAPAAARSHRRVSQVGDTRERRASDAPELSQKVRCRHLVLSRWLAVAVPCGGAVPLPADHPAASCRGGIT